MPSDFSVSNIIIRAVYTLTPPEKILNTSIKRSLSLSVQLPDARLKTVIDSREAVMKNGPLSCGLRC